MSITITNVTTRKISNNYSAEFNGVNSQIDTGVNLFGSGARTVLTWVKLYSYGAGTYGRMLGEDVMQLNVLPNSSFSMRRGGFSNATSATGVVPLNKWLFMGVVSEADGTTTLYIGDQHTAPSITGAANQNAGTPSGTDNLFIGNKPDGLRSFDGLIPVIEVVDKVLTIQEITQWYTNSLKRIN